MDSEHKMFCVNTALVVFGLSVALFFARACVTYEDSVQVQRYCIERGNAAVDCSKLGKITQ
jgi:hypothetical protein